MALALAMIWPLLYPGNADPVGVLRRPRLQAQNRSLERGSKQRLVGGITKSHRCAVVMKHSGSDRET